MILELILVVYVDSSVLEHETNMGQQNNNTEALYVVIQALISTLLCV